MSLIRILRLTLLLSLSSFAFAGADGPDAALFQQLGADIDGEAQGEDSGWSVSLSADGTVVAIGATSADGSGSNSGTVRLYSWDGAAWNQLGADIDGEAANDRSGYSVSLSADGRVVAIGARANDGNSGNPGHDSGHVRLYGWDGAAWNQLGADIDGEAANDRSGWSVSLSADGTVVAIGADYNAGNGIVAGHVRLYSWNGSNWAQRGSDIDGEAAEDFSGSSVSLSADGSVVAIGAPRNDGNGDRSGHVRLYGWDGAAWNQFGADIDGEAPYDESGSSVSLSADGTVVAIGAYSSGSDSGQVRLYGWDGAAWNQLGADIDGEAQGDASGWSVSLSADGTLVAIGARTNDGNGDRSGHVRLYGWDGAAWNQLGADIDGEAPGDRSGHSVSLSADGTVVAIGADMAANGGSGHVRVYRVDTDGDGVPDNIDAFINDPAASVDTDGDGKPDEWNDGKSAADSTSDPALALDDDDDNDGVLDTADAFPLISLGSLTDTDGDGRPNDCDSDCQTLGMTADTDDDNDGVLDIDDAFPLISTEPSVFTFAFTGTQQEFLVPAGVTQIVAEVYGAQGGDPTYGGKGGLVKAEIAVTAGDQLYLNVGGAGFGHDDINQNGWNGGGKDFNSSNYTLTGGGASDIRLGGVVLANRIVVAGGGGQRAIPIGYGGAGGGDLGQDGPNVTSATGGTGGSQTAGGLGGCGNIYCGARGDGSLGQGGKGDGDNGHGGGGYYGGGGGGSSGGIKRGGGGGGSSYIDPSVEVIANDQGVREGDGYIKLTFGPVDIIEHLGDPFLGSESEYLSNSALNSDGQVIAIANASHGMIFDWIDNNWRQRGEKIVFPSGYEFGDPNVRLSGDGNVVTFDKYYDTSNARAFVYAWDETVEQWVQRGEDLYGTGTRWLQLNSISYDGNANHSRGISE